MWNTEEARASSPLCKVRAPYVLLILLIQSELQTLQIFVLRRSSIRLPREKGEVGGEKSFWVIYSERKQTKPGHRSRALTLL